MPQFKPFWWINLISWLLTIFVILIGLNQTIFLPATLNSIISRSIIIFK